MYEIDTWVWLSSLSEKSGNLTNLSSVPSAEWDAIAKFGFNAVWLMKVWKRSPAGITIANRNKSLLGDFRRAVPDFRPQDNVGSRARSMTGKGNKMLLPKLYVELGPWDLSFFQCGRLQESGNIGSADTDGGT
jgi:hypothetical protein